MEFIPNPMLFPVNTILACTSQFSVQSSAATRLPAYSTNKFVVMNTLIVTLNFTVTPILFPVSMPVHYHPVTRVVSYTIYCYAL